MQILKQKRLFHKREFEILESKLYYREKTIGKSDSDVKIPFEELSSHKSIRTTSSVVYLWCFLGAFFLGLIAFSSRNDKDTDPDTWIVFALLGFAALIAFFINQENSWKIKVTNGTFVFLYKNKPNEKEVNEFIDNLFLARNKYLRETYMKFDRNLNYEDLYKDLKWLRYVEAITKEEFDDKYDELKKVFKYDKKTIGFDR
ncbi:MAG: hypothetical protein ABI426_00440 [Flavobacterium sp.]